MLRRSEQDGVTMEDLDTLQLEMEAMLAATVAKKNSLTDEAKLLDNMDKHIKSGGKAASASLGKRVSVATCFLSTNAAKLIRLLAGWPFVAWQAWLLCFWRRVCQGGQGRAKAVQDVWRKQRSHGGRRRWEWWRWGDVGKDHRNAKN